MADPASYGNLERDVEQALVTLKKGTQLIKYCRKGKPKLCLFRVSTYETTLIWYSHGEERNSETFKAIHAQAESFINLVESSRTSVLSAPNNGSTPSIDDPAKRIDDHLNAAATKDTVNNLLESKKTSANTREAIPQSSENGSRSHVSSTPTEGEKQIIEQFEPGVYVTLVVLQNGTKVFKRVRFSKRRFDEHQAEDWWNKNKDMLLKRYNPSTPNPVPSPNNQTPSEDNNEVPSTSKVDV